MLLFQKKGEISPFFSGDFPLFIDLNTRIFVSAIKN